MADTSIVVLLVRMVVAMGVVIGLMVLAGRMLAGRAGVGPARTKNVPIEVLARRGLGRNASIAVVRAAGKALVIGVTEGSVTVLAETDPELLSIDQEPAANWTAEPGEAPARPGPTWMGFLDTLRERTVRR